MTVDTQRSKTVFGYHRGEHRAVNRGVVVAWRLGLGWLINASPEVVGRMMVLVTRGRRSGLLRQTPLGYAEGEGAVYAISGFGRVADWCRNVEADPRVEVWLPDGRWRGTVTRVEEPAERLRWLREVLKEQRLASTRMAHIDPDAISDEELSERAPQVQVVRIALEEPIAESPADLWWVWPSLGVGALIGLAIGRLAINPPATEPGRPGSR